VRLANIRSKNHRALLPDRLFSGNPRYRFGGAIERCDVPLAIDRENTIRNAIEDHPRVGSALVIWLSVVHTILVFAMIPVQRTFSDIGKRRFLNRDPLDTSGHDDG
jgi:hypothetical protein